MDDLSAPRDGLQRQRRERHIDWPEHVREKRIRVGRDRIERPHIESKREPDNPFQDLLQPEKERNRRERQFGPARGPADGRGADCKQNCARGKARFGGKAHLGSLAHSQPPANPARCKPLLMYWHFRMSCHNRPVR